jgi:hypothetical protein
MQRGDRRGARAARIPRSSSPVHPCICTRLHLRVRARLCVCECRLCVCVYICTFVHALMRACICKSRVEARRDACSVQTIIGIALDVKARDTRRRLMLRRQTAMRASAGAQPALRVTDAPPSRPRPSCAGLLKDLHVYDPASEAWTDLSAALSGTPPSPRAGHGFTSAGGKLYVHGSGASGEGGAGRAEGVGMVGAEAGRRDVLSRDRRRGGQAGMGQGGSRDGGRADEGAGSVRVCLRACSR